MDDILASIEGATEIATIKDGDPPVSLSDAGITEAELNVALTSSINFTTKGYTI